MGWGAAPDELPLSNESESVYLCRSDEPSGVAALCVVVTTAAFVFSLLCCSASEFTRVGAEVSLVVSVGVAGLEIQMPSTWTPLWIARTPKGIELAKRLEEVGRSPVLRMSSILAFFSSSRISCFRTIRFVRQSLTRPAQNTATMATASALG